MLKCECRITHTADVMLLAVKLVAQLSVFLQFEQQEQGTYKKKPQSRSEV